MEEATGLFSLDINVEPFLIWAVVQTCAVLLGCSNKFLCVLLKIQVIASWVTGYKCTWLAYSSLWLKVVS